VKVLADIDLTRCPTSRLSNDNPFVSVPVSFVFHLYSYTRPEQRVQTNVCKVVLTKNGLYDRWFNRLNASDGNLLPFLYLCWAIKALLVFR
jgi:hypothetical protein